LAQSHGDRRFGAAGRPTRRRWRPLIHATIALLGLAASTVFVPPTGGAHASTISTDKTKIRQLEQKIQQQGAAVQSLVEQYGALSEQVNVIHQRIAIEQSQLAQDALARAKAVDALKSLAVDAYVSQAAGSSAALAAIGNSKSGEDYTSKQEYVDAANARMDAAVTALEIVQRQTQATEAVLRSKEAAIAPALAAADAAQQSAQNALTQDNATLGHVHGNLLALVTAAAEAAAQAKEKAEEDALASSQQPTSGSVPTPVIDSTPGSYADPLRAVSGLASERIDQGVDYRGFGPIYAIGDGVVLSTYNGGWPGGTFITYRLTDGPANGLVVYAAEDISPTVQVGEVVSARTQIGSIYEGPDGIETGWSDPAGNGNTMAADYGQFGGSDTTAFGYSFDRLLLSLGAPGGVLQNPPYGNLPAGWPSF
jgi:murein DD-endopeptidase MepM/ murein hydrolase activator NlpD